MHCNLSAMLGNISGNSLQKGFFTVLACFKDKAYNCSFGMIFAFVLFSVSETRLFLWRLAFWSRLQNPRLNITHCFVQKLSSAKIFLNDEEMPSHLLFACF
jgi:hypothetical protein